VQRLGVRTRAGQVMGREPPIEMCRPAEGRHSLGWAGFEPASSPEPPLMIFLRVGWSDQDRLASRRAARVLDMP
jgi:hypothetical protein